MALLSYVNSGISKKSLIVDSLMKNRDNNYSLNMKWKLVKIK